MMMNNPLYQPPLWLITALYYVVWIGTVQLAARGLPTEGAALHFAFGVSLIWLSKAERRPRLWSRALIGSLIGYTVDSSLVLIGLISFPEQSALLGPSPVWMVSLWFTFAVLLNGSLQWLLASPALAVSLGLVGGPLSYLGGAQSGAMLTHGPTWRAALIIGLSWGVIMGLSAWLWRPQAEGTPTPQSNEEQATPERGEPH